MANELEQLRLEAEQLKNQIRVSIANAKDEVVVLWGTFILMITCCSTPEPRR